MQRISTAIVTSAVLVSPLWARSEHAELLKTLAFIASLVFNIPITPAQLRTYTYTHTLNPMDPLRHPMMRPKTRTSSIVSVVMDKYISALSSHNLGLTEHHREIITGFLSTLVACDNLSETVLPPADLLTMSTPTAFHVGTGLTVTKTIAAAIANAKHSVLFSTCFWAESQSREVLAEALRDLSHRALANIAGRKVVVRIGFSSSSAAQKLFHTSSPQGKTHLPSTWATMGLPGPEELLGLDMSVKSIFFLPFSVLHSKFCIVDGHTLFLPSANISWETWLEQCTTLTGPIVTAFTQFWQQIWAGSNVLALPPPADSPDPPPPTSKTYPTIFLPHPHHRNPSFRPSLPLKALCFPSAPPPLPPSTPQNTFLLHALNCATTNVYLHTPNLTSQPLLHALEAALARGVNIDIVTCRGMMFIEQLVTTAGTATTEGCMRSLIKADESLRAGRGYVARQQRVSKGLLGIWYYTGASTSRSPPAHPAEDAVQSHVKAMIFDAEITVLGSANGDRASWYTSQEVNVAVFGKEFARDTRRELVKALGGRVERVVGVAGLLEEAVGTKAAPAAETMVAEMA
ncbi:hypothetical protein BZA05DRAFT_353371 [Tricharina praecox]|uniref:uncharacterized protein n=1 Tax=Tricharina praecox TaxID=43433 RepID=UPI00221EDFBB|nr:uncharacterized protein BZA05DRAFT_353371 [Tricharina praecox]KAI5851806.1 hypothetical protein BZA05DRAFT_353371 [Tricharina praecox]